MIRRIPVVYEETLLEYVRYTGLPREEAIAAIKKRLPGCEFLPDGEIPMADFHVCDTRPGLPGCWEVACSVCGVTCYGHGTRGRAKILCGKCSKLKVRQP